MVYVSQKVTVQGLIVLLLSVHLATTDVNEWKVRGETEYLLIPGETAKTFNDSKKRCKTEGANLTAPKSRDEHDFIVEKVNPNNQETWVGVVCQRNAWRYVDGSGLAVFTHWHKDTNDSAPCTHNTSHVATDAKGFWTRAGELEEKKYICHRDRRQYFKVKPSDTTVKQGETAILHCTVGFEKGQTEDPKVQWLRNGFPLGHSVRDPNITGYPRHSMDVSVDWNKEEGQYDLVIKNTKSSDTGKYDCQVSPTENNLEIRIQAHARLTVKEKANGGTVMTSTTMRETPKPETSTPAPATTEEADSQTTSQGNTMMILSWLVSAACALAVIRGWW